MKNNQNNSGIIKDVLVLSSIIVFSLLAILGAAFLL